MAIAFGAISAVSTSQTPTSVTVSGSNTIGIVRVNGEVASDDITAVTWDGVAMTKIAAVQTPGDRWQSVWCVANPTSGAVISFTGGTFWRSVSWYYTGANQTGQPDSFNTGTSAASNAITVATTVVAANSWYVMSQGDGLGSRVYTPSGVLASTRYDNDAGGMAIADSAGTVGTGSQSGTMTQTVGIANHAAIAFSIAPVSAAISVGRPNNLMLLGVS